MLEYLERLRGDDAIVYVVTNSGTEEVNAALTSLGEAGAWVAKNVHGNAKKFVIDDSHPLAIPGLVRRAAAGRPHYEKVLRDIMLREGCPPSSMVVVGDILEFDLLLPLRLGMQISLVGDHSLEYERAFVAANNGVNKFTPWSIPRQPSPA